MPGVATYRSKFAAYRRPVQIGLFIEAPLIMFGWLVLWAAQGGKMQDFVWLRRGAAAVLDGHSPYAPLDPSRLIYNNTFVYPPVDAYGLVPFALVPRAVAALIFVVAGCAAVLLALRLLDVTDWRCYGIVWLSPAVFFALSVGALGPFMLLGTAAAWRYRRQASLVALCVGLTVIAKLFMWPLIVWLAATRRWKAALGATAVAVSSAIVSWAAIGFAGMAAYPALLRDLVRAQEVKSYSFGGLAIALGLPAVVGTAALVTAAVAGCLLTVRVARRPMGDERAFFIAVFTALLATPLLWSHYLILLYAPIALLRPRLSAAWGVPVLLWLTPYFEAEKVAWRSIVLLSVTFLLGILLYGQPGMERLARFTRGRIAIEKDRVFVLAHPGQH